MLFLCWIKEYWLFSFLLSMVAFGVLCIFAISQAISIHDKKVIQIQRDAFKNLDPQPSSHDTLVFEYLLARESMYYKTYFRWQALSKIFGILSVFLSIGTLALSYDASAKNCTWQTTIISLFATGFVVFSLYMKPDKKSREYIKAWRQCNRLVNDILYSNTPFKEVPIKLADIEDELPSDED